MRRGSSNGRTIEAEYRFSVRTQRASLYRADDVPRLTLHRFRPGPTGLGNNHRYCHRPDGCGGAGRNHYHHRRRNGTKLQDPGYRDRRLCTAGAQARDLYGGRGGAGLSSNGAEKRSCYRWRKNRRASCSGCRQSHRVGDGDLGSPSAAKREYFARGQLELGDRQQHASWRPARLHLPGASFARRCAGGSRRSRSAPAAASRPTASARTARTTSC